MKVKSTTIIFILAILFILIGGLSYFFYIKYKTSMNYVNEQFTAYNLHIQKQLSSIMDQYKNYLSYKNKLTDSPYDQEQDEYLSEEQKSVINQLHKELKTIEEEDLEDLDEYQKDKKLDYNFDKVDEEETKSLDEDEEETKSLDEDEEETKSLDEDDEDDEGYQEDDEETELEKEINVFKKDIGDDELDSIIQKLENKENIPMLSSDEDDSIDIEN